ncbi:DUF6325 family protein [Phytoactinopolyspora endophytica]|uniref:DUF6325 family protein n=1 Tax=Phytoactinopolyspora endophytica TaxID=1642495 RepID=UPI00101E13F4|nr:DUF6325 family protein [Phytoactinopolyspora endophytica]
MDDSGPVELVLVEFPGNEFTGEIVSELARLVDNDTIELLDVILIRKQADGSVQWLEATEADDVQLAELVGEPAGLLGAEDVEDIAAELKPDSSVGMMLFEHSWAARLASAVSHANGRLIDSQRVPAAAVDELRSMLEEVSLP